MIHWGKIFYFLHGSLRMVRKNSLRRRMVYNPLGKNLLFPSWLIGNGKEKLIEEVVLILPTRGGGGLSTLWGKFSLQLLGKLHCALDPRESSSMLMTLTHWAICVGSTHIFHVKDLKFAYPGLRIKETQQKWLLS